MSTEITPSVPLSFAPAVEFRGACTPRSLAVASQDGQTRSLAVLIDHGDRITCSATPCTASW